MSKLLTFSILFSLLVSHAQERPIVGAIRWDAWLGESNNVGKDVNQSLSPNHWHYRLPFYSEVLGTDSVNIDGTTQDIANKEIEYAHHAKLDYFAFLLYDDTYRLSDGIHLFLSSPIKDSVNFCAILNEITSETVEETTSRV